MCRRWTLTAAHRILPPRRHRLRQELKNRDVEGEGRKTCTELVECREEEEDLKDLHLGGDKQTQRHDSGKQPRPRKSHHTSFILMFPWVWGFSNKQSLKSTTVCLQGPIFCKYLYIHLFFFKLTFPAKYIELLRQRAKVELSGPMFVSAAPSRVGKTRRGGNLAEGRQTTPSYGFVFTAKVKRTTTEKKKRTKD